MDITILIIGSMTYMAWREQEHILCYSPCIVFIQSCVQSISLRWIFIVFCHKVLYLFNIPVLSINRWPTMWVAPVVGGGRYSGFFNFKYGHLLSIFRLKTSLLTHHTFITLSYFRIFHLLLTYKRRKGNI